MTVFEKIKEMSYEEMVLFFKVILASPSWLDDKYCVYCENSNGGCPHDDFDCNISEVDILNWFLNSSYDSIFSKK